MPYCKQGRRKPYLSAALASPQAVAMDIAKRLNISTATLYTYVNGDGSLKAMGEQVLLAQSCRMT